MNNINIDQITLNKDTKEFLNGILKECKKIFSYVFWFSSGINILVLFLPIYTAQVLDRVLSSGSISTLLMLTVITITAFLCSSALDMCRSFVMMRVGDWLDGKLSPYFVKKAISLIAIRNSSSTGEAMRDLNMIRGFITGQGIFVMFDMPWSIVYLIAIFMIHPVSGFIAILGIVILVSLAIWNEFSVKQSIKESNELNIKNINEIEVASRNAEVVEAMGMMEHIVNSWDSKNDKTRELNIKAGSRSAVIMSITKFCRMALQISVIGTGAYLAVEGSKTVGGIIAASILMGRVLSPFENAINVLKQLSLAKISYKRLQILLTLSPERKQSMQLPEPEGKIVFDRVVYTPFNGQKPTVKGVSFEVMPGDIVGVIGPSASGKSTLAKLLVGVWQPISGVVRIDNADVYTYPRKEFGKYVGYLPQDIELFNDTIKNNISRMKGDDEVDVDLVVKAAKVAGVHEMILSLPTGYDTLIGPGGVMLSGGQRQRIALARVYYGNIKLAVLDEPNSNLDSKGDSALVHSIEYMKKNKITAFLMTHKLEILRYVDKIIIMNDGSLVSMGSRDEILSRITQQQTNSENQEEKK